MMPARIALIAICILGLVEISGCRATNEPRTSAHHTYSDGDGAIITSIAPLNILIAKTKSDENSWEYLALRVPASAYGPPPSELLGSGTRYSSLEDLANDIGSQAVGTVYLLGTESEALSLFYLTEEEAKDACLHFHELGFSCDYMDW